MPVKALGLGLGFLVRSDEGIMYTRINLFERTHPKQFLDNSAAESPSFAFEQPLFLHYSSADAAMMPRVHDSVHPFGRAVVFLFGWHFTPFPDTTHKKKWEFPARQTTMTQDHNIRGQKAVCDGVCCTGRRNMYICCKNPRRSLLSSA